MTGVVRLYIIRSGHEPPGAGRGGGEEGALGARDGQTE
jgi:hypothetical protein